MADYWKRCPERILATELRKEIKAAKPLSKHKMECMRLYAQVTGIIGKGKKKKAASQSEPVNHDRLRTLLASVEETEQ